MSEPWKRWGRNPSSPADFPEETEEELARRGRSSMDLLVAERGSTDDPANLEREIQRASAVAGPAAESGPWTQFGGATTGGSGPWTQFGAGETPVVAPEKKQASWWETIKGIPGSALGQMVQAVGGSIMEAATVPPAPPYGAPLTGLERADANSDPMQYHVRLLAKKQGRPVEEVARELEQEMLKTPTAKAGEAVGKKGTEIIEANTPADMSMWQRYVHMGGSSAIAQSGGLIMSAATKSPGPALAQAGVMAKGSSFAEKTQAGMSPNEASMSSNIDATAEVVFEFVPTTYLFNHLGGPVLQTMIRTMLMDVPLEGVTAAVQAANAKISHKPEMGWEEYGQNILDAMGAAVVGGPLTYGIGKGAHMAFGRQPAEEPIILPGVDTAPPAGVGAGGPGVTLVGPGENGAESTVQTAPTFDLLTNELGSAAEIALEAKAYATRPEDITDEMLEQGRKVLADIKEKEQRPPLPQAEQAWSQIATAPTTAVEDAGEIGASQRQADNAQNYINPNQGDRLDRIISFGPEQSIGLTPRQFMPEATTYVLGQVSEDRNAEWLGGAREEIEWLRQKYLPDATIVLSNEQLYNDSALGWHHTSGFKKHLIVPAVLRKPSRGWAAYNPNTIATAYYNLIHEFGHALMSDRFYQVDSDQTVGAIRDASRNGLVPEALLRTLPAEQQAVVKEFNAMKARILDDSMTAQQFIDEWIGPAKAGRKTFLKELGVAPGAPAKQLVNALTVKARKNARIQTEDAAAALQQRAIEDYLSLDEYLAEQLTRFAHQKQWDQSSPIAKLFGSILSGLRGVFTDAKKNGLIAPGVAFNTWMEGLGKIPRVMEEKKSLLERKVVQSKLPKKAAVAAKPAKAPKKKKASPKVETVQHNVESDTSAKWEKSARGAVMNLIRAGVMKREDSDYAELMSFANRGEREEFRELYTTISKKTVNFELDKLEPANFLDDSKYLYHAVRNDQDLDAIFAEGLRPGTNLSDLQGQAFTDEGGTFVVVEKKAGKKAYQGDYVSQESLRPVAILKDTFIHERKGYTKEESNIELDKIEQELASLERKTWLSEEERDKAQEKIMQRSDRILARTDKPTIDTEGVLSQYSRHNVPVIPIEIRYDEKKDTTKVFRKRGHVKKTSFELDATQSPDWEDGKFDSPEFKAFFGDWVRDPVGSSKIRIAAFRQDGGIISVDNESVTPPLVVFATADRLKQGANAFHASTPRGQQFAESRSTDSPDDLTLVPVVLNIRNPFIQGDLSDPAPSRAELQAQGYDGIVYQNSLDGDLSFVVFSPEQIRAVPDRSPYIGQHGFHLELDTDTSTKQGWGAAKFYNSIKNFVENPERLKRAFQHAKQGTRFAMQMQQIAQKNPDVIHSTFMRQAITDYSSYNASRLHIPNKILDTWTALSNKAFEKVNRFLKAQEASGQRWFELTETNKLVEGRIIPWYELRRSATTDAKLKEFGIDPETSAGKKLLTHILNIENSLLDFLNENQRVLINLLALRLGHNALAFEHAKNAVIRDIHALRLQPFLPRKWFGKYMVMIRERSGTGYEVVHKEAFDYALQRDEAFGRLEKRLKPGQTIQKKELTDTEMVMMGLPKDFLDTVGSELGLKPEQVSRLAEILSPVKQEKLLKEHNLDLANITGHSEDLMRSYAAYTFHQANLQGKMLFRKRFNMTIGSLRREVDNLASTNHPDYYRRQGILWAMEGVRDYIMHPPNEMHTVRALISLAYLMGNVKTAIANGTGLALTWIDLTARHGSLKGEAMFFQAVYRNSVAVFAKEKNPEYIQKGLERAQQEGALDQTYAYHAAGMANSNRLWRVLSRSGALRYLQKDVELAMMPFRLMELFTRRVTFLAALEENHQRKVGPDPATAKKMGTNDAYKAAVEKVNGLQNDYTAGNRIPLMRGKMSAVTIFMSFAQHGGWHGLGQYESGQRRLIEHEIDIKQRPESDRPTKMDLLSGHTMRLWALMLALAGYQGMPFMENFLDVAEWIWRRFGKRTIRHELRELIKDPVDNPHLWARGFSHNVAGLDFSRSVGWGSLLPGTDMLAKSQKDNFDEHVGTLSLDLAGVTGNTIKWLYEMSPMSDKPFEKAMSGAPGLGGNMWNSYQWSKHGVRGPGGGLITKDQKTGEMRDLTAVEIWAKALGANPNIVSANRELRYEQYDRLVYWSTRRSRLKQNVWRGIVQEDADLEAMSREAIQEFNEWLGTDPEWRKLRIDNAELSKYIQLMKKRQRQEEAEKPTNKRFSGIYQDIRESHEGPDEEGNP